MERRSLLFLLLLATTLTATAQINYEISGGTLRVMPYSAISPNSRLLPGSITSDSEFDCLTEEMTDDEFFAQPWIGNNQYLNNLLNSQNFPPGGGPHHRGVEPTTLIRYKIPVQFWVYRSDAGQGGITEFRLQQLIDELNNDNRASNTGFRFYMIDNVNVIDNSNLTTMNGIGNIGNWISGRYNPAAMNVHVVDEISGATAGLMTIFPNKAIIIRNDLVFPSQHPTLRRTSTMVHEAGHFFGLSHTFRGQFWRGSPVQNCHCEPIDHSRTFSIPTGCPAGMFSGKKKCEVAGDGLCDTPADPQIKRGDFNENNLDCAYINQDERDIYGDSYFAPPPGNLPPPIRNIMAYGAPGCRTEITRDQIGVMHHNVSVSDINPRSNFSNKTLWSNPNIVFDIFEPDRTVATAREITLNEYQDHTLYKQFETNQANDVDWLFFRVPPEENGKFYTLKTRKNSIYNDADTKLTLYSVTGNPGEWVLGAALTTDSGSGGNNYAVVSQTLSTGTYAVKVENETLSQFGDYSIGMYNCADPELVHVTGPDNICNSGSFGFTVHGIPSGIGVVWTKSSSVDFVSISGSTYSVVGNASASSGWVSAKTCNGTIVATKSFSIGVVPNNQLSVTGDQFACPGEQVEYRAAQAPQGYTYDWHYPTSNGWQFVDGDNNINLTLIAGTQSAAISYSLVSSCGTSTASTPFWTTVNSCFGRMAVYPNPATEELTVELPDDGDGTESKKIRKNRDSDVVLYDKEQREVYKTKMNGQRSVRIPLHNLPDGTYYIGVVNKEAIERRQIVIKK